MDIDAMKEALTPFRGSEAYFRELAQCCPAAYETPNAGWQDFRDRCDKLYGVMLPEESPLYMGPKLSENELFSPQGARMLPRSPYFSAPSDEAMLIMHDRVVPPYHETLDFLKIVYCVGGYFTAYSGGKSLTLGEGDFIIIPPDTDHSVFAPSQQSLAMNIILKRSTFESAYASLLSGSGMISDFFWHMLFGRTGANILAVCSGGDGAIYDIIARLYAETSVGSEANSLLIRGYILQLFGLVMKYHSGDIISIVPQPASYTKFSAVIRYIRENFRTVTLSSLSEHFSCSVSWLSRYIRAQTGLTFRFLLRQFRLEQACKMLSDSNCTIEEIVSATGYEEPSRFYKNFKDAYGVTPAVYRQRQRSRRL